MARAKKKKEPLLKLKDGRELYGVFAGKDAKGGGIPIRCTFMSTAEQAVWAVYKTNVEDPAKAMADNKAALAKMYAVLVKDIPGGWKQPKQPIQAVWEVLVDEAPHPDQPRTVAPTAKRAACNVWNNQFRKHPYLGAEEKLEIYSHMTARVVFGQEREKPKRRRKFAPKGQGSFFSD